MTCLEGEQRPKGALWIQWEAPWNRAVDEYTIFILDAKKEYSSKTTVTAISGFKPGSDVDFIIRSVIGEWKGEYGPILTCTV